MNKSDRITEYNEDRKLFFKRTRNEHRDRSTRKAYINYMKANPVYFTLLWGEYITVKEAADVMFGSMQDGELVCTQ
jgi:hypothetical protein